MQPSGLECRVCDLIQVVRDVAFADVSVFKDRTEDCTPLTGAILVVGDLARPFALKETLVNPPLTGTERVGR
ncbi:hypothetical protein D3C84_893000 [compost metagenome]